MDIAKELSETYATANRAHKLEEQLAATQAREKVMLNALATCITPDTYTRTERQEFDADLVEKALNLPADDTALNNLLAAERKKCLKAAKKASNNDASQLIQEILNAIRALGD